MGCPPCRQGPATRPGHIARPASRPGRIATPATRAGQTHKLQERRANRVACRKAPAWPAALAASMATAGPKTRRASGEGRRGAALRARGAARGRRARSLARSLALAGG
eukprot:CAMPEP_0202100336 /NCGR_PEP_ID=MMETSP0965-20130614/3092_1 /ASSEMBLY_ACC=CAM_ASM_000507 /TAXON_ID=4773 /ORGANISM="Schizochytrium aggregatum, Strain ATCC28209" /LENGTH=107 /DNA_ID=CAMNT_0048668993 /DNA_START=769 /DNA_END=1088 /DNA_ORIENTATION=-